MNAAEDKIFKLIERTIIEAIASIEDQVGHGDLHLAVAVFAKLAADAAIDCEIDEELFVSSMRKTYQVMDAANMYVNDEGESK